VALLIVLAAVYGQEDPSFFTGNFQGPKTFPFHRVNYFGKVDPFRPPSDDLTCEKLKQKMQTNNSLPINLAATQQLRNNLAATHQLRNNLPTANQQLASSNRMLSLPNDCPTSPEWPVTTCSPSRRNQSSNPLITALGVRIPRNVL
jgi:hypothetical protein